MSATVQRGDVQVERGVRWIVLDAHYEAGELMLSRVREDSFAHRALVADGSLPAHPSSPAWSAPEPEPTRNRVEAAGVDGLTALGQGDAP